MQIKRDYTQPFFRQPKRRRLRNGLLLALLTLLLGAALVWQREMLLAVVTQLSANPPTATAQPQELALRATLLMQAGDMARAEELLARALAESPNHLGYLYEHGRVLIELERYVEARLHGEDLATLAPKDPRGFALQAAALTWQGQPASAVPIALAGLQADPRFSPLYAVLTRAYVDAQRWQDALETAERGLNIAPNDAALHRSYAYALQSVGAFNQAIDQFQHAIELRPAYLPPHFELAALYLARDDDQSAIDLYNRILSLNPRNARAMLRLCLAYRKVGEFSRAFGFCEDAVSRAPTNPEALFQLGLLHYRERQFEASRDAFAQCLEHDIEGTYELSCRYRLGLSHYYTGNCTRGWSLLRDSLGLAQAANESETLNNILLALEIINADSACIDDAAATVPFGIDPTRSLE